jgi:hypothetical protein
MLCVYRVPRGCAITMLQLPSQNSIDSLVMTLASRYIASTWTAQKTPLPTVLLLFRHVAITRRERRLPVTSLLRVYESVAAIT